MSEYILYFIKEHDLFTIKCGNAYESHSDLSNAFMSLGIKAQIYLMLCVQGLCA